MPMLGLFRWENVIDFLRILTVIVVNCVFILIESRDCLFSHIFLLKPVTKLLEFTQTPMVHPVKRLATLAQIINAIVEDAFLRLKYHNVTVFLNKPCRQVEQVLCYLILRLRPIVFVNVLDKSLVLRCILRRVLPLVQVCMLDVQWILLRVDFTVAIVEGHGIED